jgi:hypothetical protein
MPNNQPGDQLKSANENHNMNNNYTIYGYAKDGSYFKTWKPVIGIIKREGIGVTAYQVLYKDNEWQNLASHECDFITINEYSQMIDKIFSETDF